MHSFSKPTATVSPLPCSEEWNLRQIPPTSQPQNLPALVPMHHFGNVIMSPNPVPFHPLHEQTLLHPAHTHSSHPLLIAPSFCLATSAATVTAPSALMVKNPTAASQTALPIESMMTHEAGPQQNTIKIDQLPSSIEQTSPTISAIAVTELSSTCKSISESPQEYANRLRREKLLAKRRTSESTLGLKSSPSMDGNNVKITSAPSVPTSCLNASAPIFVPGSLAHQVKNDEIKCVTSTTPFRPPFPSSSICAASAFGPISPGVNFTPPICTGHQCRGNLVCKCNILTTHVMNNNNNRLTNTSCITPSVDSKSAPVNKPKIVEHALATSMNDCNIEGISSGVKSKNDSTRASTSKVPLIKYDRLELFNMYTALKEKYGKVPRPACISHEFDNEHGIFQPHKWIERVWLHDRQAGNITKMTKLNDYITAGNVYGNGSGFTSNFGRLPLKK